MVETSIAWTWWRKRGKVGRSRQGRSISGCTLRLSPLETEPDVLVFERE
jgi:hypothetical protein